MIIRLLPLCLVAGLTACAAGGPSPGYDATCARQCEQIYWTCKAGCPKDVGAAIGCSTATCNPAKAECLASCPRIAPTNIDEVQANLTPQQRQLLQLQGRLDRGEITDAEYMAQRDAILRPPPAP